MTAPLDTTRSPRLTWRLRLVAWCAGLVAIAFIQTPGRIATDTKLDLTVDPVGFLARALTLWDPDGAFGQVQNQAYGYLFPMGPFFVVGDLLQLPPWVTQRLWWALVLVVAFLGVVKLCAVLDIGVGWTRIAAGLVFALSPRMLTVIGPSSIEVWPSAVAPWVLVPLVIGIRRGSVRRAAALSGLAVACVGGVNAAATFAVVPLAAWWLLCAPGGERRRAMMRWWPPMVLLGTLWWLLPLFLLGRFSPPFLDYIESSANTTFAGTAFDALRGTTNWVPYVDPDSVAGNDLLTQSLLIANLTVLLCLGVLGLTRADLPHRRFLVVGLLTGMALVTLGHTGTVQGLGADGWQSLLDGVLAPLRNTHKFDVVVRLPLVLAACHAMTRLTRGRTAVDGARRLDLTTVGVAFLAVTAVVGATVPAWSATIANRRSFVEVPGYWGQAATWLESNAQGRTLLAPATGFGSYAWGKTADEPLQPLMSSPWAVRNLIPLTPGGTIGMMDAVSDRFATGEGGSGFARYLRRAGIGTIVVRNDLDRNQDIVPPELVRATLTSTPGMRRVAAFGPEVGGGPTLTNDEGAEVFVDDGWQTNRPAIEVFALSGTPDPEDTSRQAAASTPVLVGDSDSLMTLDDLGASLRSVVMAKDADTSTRYGGTILTDGNRRQESSFGTVAHQRSASLTEQEGYSAKRRVHRYDEEALAPWTTTPVLEGARSIASSSSDAEVGAVPSIDQSAQTWAAFDGDPSTAWRPSIADAGSTAWVRIDLDGRVDAGTATIRLAQGVDDTRVVTITTETGPRELRIQGPAPVTVDVGRVSSVELSGRTSFDAPLEVRGIDLSGVPVSRPLVLPTLPAAWGAPSTILLQEGPNYAEGCLTLDGDVRCSRSHHEEGDSGRTLDRRLTLPAAQSYDLQVRAAPVGGGALTELAQRGRLVTASASSQLTTSARTGALAAVDGEQGTGWVAADDDLTPALTVNWVGERRISRLRLETSELLAASAPTAVSLRFSDGSQQEADVVDGVVEFDAVRSSSVRIRVTESTTRYSVGFGGATSQLPIGVSELSVDGLGGLPIALSEQPRRWACGSGPTVSVDGVALRTRLVASPAELADGRTVPARPCVPAPVDLGEGEHRVVVTSTESVRPVDVGLRSTTPADPGVATGDLEVTTHNTNPGWSADQDGTDLAPVVLNGWQQGWSLPTASAGSGDRVVSSFGPGTAYRLALAVGALLALALVVLAARGGHSDLPAPAARRRRLRTAVTAGVAVVAIALVGGWWGIAAALLGAALPVAAGTRRAAATPWVATSAVAVAGTISVLRPWGGAQQWAGQLQVVQLLVLVALGCVAAGAVAPKAFLRRRNGSSTQR